MLYAGSLLYRINENRGDSLRVPAFFVLSCENHAKIKYSSKDSKNGPLICVLSGFSGVGGTLIPRNFARTLWPADMGGRPTGGVY